MSGQAHGQGADLFRRAATRGPDVVAFIEADRTWTWGQLDDRAHSLGVRLTEEAVGPDASVVVVMANDGASAAAFYAALRTGATVVLLHVTTGTAEYDDVVRRVSPRVVLGPATGRERLAGDGPRWLDIDAPPCEGIPEGTPDTSLAVAATARVLLFTSGTTARAKGVIHSVESLDAAARNFLDAASLGADDRFFLVSPLASVTGVLQALFMAPRVGASVVLVSHWDDRAATDLLLETGATFYGGPDVILARLFAELERRGERRLPLHAVALGGTMLDPDLLQRTEDRGVSVLRAYGSSEVPFSTVTPREASRAERIERDGRTLPGVTLRLGSARDPREICVRGPHMLRGFLDEEDAKESLVEGWYLTGDLGSVESGSLKVEGRIKEIVIRNGIKVSLPEVERAVASLAEVDGAVAFRVPDADTGEHLGVAVRLRAGAPFDGDRLVAELRATGLATVKLPEELVDWLGPFPLTPSGKVVRDEVARSDQPRWHSNRLRALQPAPPRRTSAR